MRVSRLSTRLSSAPLAVDDARRAAGSPSDDVLTA